MSPLPGRPGASSTTCLGRTKTTCSPRSLDASLSAGFRLQHGSQKSRTRRLIRQFLQALKAKQLHRRNKTWSATRAPIEMLAGHSSARGSPKRAPRQRPAQSRPSPPNPPTWELSAGTGIRCLSVESKQAGLLGHGLCKIHTCRLTALNAKRLGLNTGPRPASDGNHACYCCVQHIVANFRPGLAPKASS